MTMLERTTKWRFDLQTLRAGVKPFRLHWFPCLKSTNSHAGVLRKAGKLFAPAIVLTGRQLAGRGRGNNAWWSGEGCLTVTFVMPIEENLSPHQLPLIAGLAVRNAAAELAGTEQIQLKWPNDIVWEGRKLAGLLCERIHKADLIGVGMNINLDPAEAPRNIRSRITSLSAITGQMFDPTQSLITIAEHLHRTLSRRQSNLFTQFLREYDRHHSLIGKQVAVTGTDGNAIMGRCEGVDDMGRLILQDKNRIHRIVTGHVTVC